MASMDFYNTNVTVYYLLWCTVIFIRKVWPFDQGDQPSPSISESFLGEKGPLLFYGIIDKRPIEV